MSTDISPVNHLSGIPRQRIWLHSRLLCHVLSTWSWCKQAWLSSGHHFDKRLHSLLVTIWYLLEHVSKLKFCLHSRVLINHPLRQWSQVNCTTAKSLLPWRKRWQLISLIRDTCNMLFRQKIYLWHLGVLFFRVSLICPTEETGPCLLCDKYWRSLWRKHLVTSWPSKLASAPPSFAVCSVHLKLTFLARLRL